MKTILFSCCFLLTSTAFAQMDNTLALNYIATSYATATPPSQVLVYASFPGGKEAFRHYLRDEIVYPELARDYGIEGTVRAEFRITPDGRAEDIRILDEPGYGCGAEAERLIREMPRWAPALQNGIATTSRKRQIAIQFRLN